jgi:3-methyl-2-oxobutanoate hydroxymethyltransferase
VPKFARAYVDLRGEIEKAATAFAADVAAGTFPDEEHSYT